MTDYEREAIRDLEKLGWTAAAADVRECGGVVALARCREAAIQDGTDIYAPALAILERFER